MGGWIGGFASFFFGREGGEGGVYVRIDWFVDILMVFL